MAKSERRALGHDEVMLETVLHLMRRRISTIPTLPMEGTRGSILKWIPPQFEMLETLLVVPWNNFLSSFSQDLISGLQRNQFLLKETSTNRFLPEALNGIHFKAAAVNQTLNSPYSATKCQPTLSSLHLHWYNIGLSTTLSILFTLSVAKRQINPWFSSPTMLKLHCGSIVLINSLCRESQNHLLKIISLLD